MTNKYRDKYYDHFSRTEFGSAPQFEQSENYMMRFFTPLRDYTFENNNLTIIFFKQGCGTLLWKDKKANIKGDKFIVTNPGQGWHYVNPEAKYIDVLSVVLSKELKAQYDFFCTATEEQLLDNPFGELEERSFFLEIPLNSNHYVSGRLLNRMYVMSEESEFGMFSAEELSLELLQSICKEQLRAYKYANKIEAKKTVTQLETLKRLLRAHDYIQDNLEKPISLTELSYESALSKHHLYESFKMVYGKTPHQFINFLKLQKSKEYLKNGNLSVSEISDYLGFSNISVFSKVFKKMYGCSPSFYLKQHF